MLLEVALDFKAELPSPQFSVNDLNLESGSGNTESQRLRYAARWWRIRVRKGVQLLACTLLATSIVFSVLNAI